MLQLVYISNVAPGLTPDVLERLLLTSRRRNIANGITGLLMFDGRRFIQLLEGDDDRVRAAFARIQTDPRHRAIVLLDSRAITRQQFGEWSMAIHVIAPAGPNGAMSAEAGALIARLHDPEVRALFQAFARGAGAG